MKEYNFSKNKNNSNLTEKNTYKTPSINNSTLIFLCQAFAVRMFFHSKGIPFSNFDLVKNVKIFTLKPKIKNKKVRKWGQSTFRQLNVG